MIHTLRQSPKFMRLVRKLRPLANGSIIDADSVATATLEKLWHATTTGAMRGDIGRFDNEVIAEMCGWLGDADLLVQTLIECRFLDECQEHRLVVHDWDEHAPNHVKGNVTRNGGFVLPVPLTTIAKGVSPGPVPKDGPQGTGAPNLTQPNPTNPNPTQPGNAASPRCVYPPEFEEFWKAYPVNAKGRRRGKKSTLDKWKLIKAEDRQDVLTAARNYASEETEYVKDPERFLRNDWWRDFVEPPKPKEQTNEFGNQLI